MGDYDDIAAQEAAKRSVTPALAPDDTYDSMAAAEADKRQQVLKASISQATQIAPDKAGKIQTLVDKTGIPHAVVERNEDVVTRRQSALELYQALQASPILSRQMTDPVFARIAQDDAPNLSMFEKVARFPWKATQAVASGLPALASGLAGVVATPLEVASKYVGKPLAGKLLPADPFGQAGAAFRRASINAESYGKQVAAVPKDAGLVEASVASGFQSLGQNLPLLISALYTGNATAALSVMSAATGGQSSTKGYQAGLDPLTNLRYGMTDAAIEYLTEIMPVTKLIGDMKAGSPFIKTLMHNQVAEQLGEQAATILQDYNEWATLQPEKPFVEYLKERPIAALQTAIATAVGSGGQVAIMHAAQSAGGRDSMLAANAEDVKALQQILQLAANSKLRERSPTTFTQFVNAATADGPVDAVYVNAAQFQQGAAEAGIDIAQAMPETAAALQDAVANGTDVRIPLGEFASAIPGTTLEQAIIPHLRTDPHGPTQQETSDAAWVADTKAQTEKILAEHEFSSTWKQSSSVVERELMTQLEQANRFTPDVNKAYAGFMSAFYATQAHRIGVTPEQMYAKYPLRIQAQSVVGANTFVQPGSLPHSVAVTAVHFSPNALTSVNTSRYGTGAKGADVPRVMGQEDARLKQRAYFYVPEGHGVRGEQGVGANAHVVQLNNLYDTDADPLRIVRDNKDATALEAAVANAGFAGYYRRGANGAQGVAVLLGPHDVSVDHVGQERDANDLLGAIAAPAPTYDDRRRLAAMLVQDTRLPAGALTPQEWKDTLADKAPELLALIPATAFRGQAAIYRDQLARTFYQSGRQTFAPAQKAAADYMASARLAYHPPVLEAHVQIERAKRIAQAYEEMKHDPSDPQVAAAYQALIDETLAQWQVIKATGLKVEFIKPGQANPYEKTPRMAIDDVRESNHLWVFPTDQGFGSDATFDPIDNPLLAPAGETVDGRETVANDIFRIVHDYFGHVKDGNGFRANGEENAWRSHAAIYTPLARRAMTSETRGQNSWVNFGPYGESNRTASAADTHYAPQKTGLLPEWVSMEGADDLTTFRQSGRVKNDTPAIRKFLKNLTASERNKITDGLAKRITEHMKKLPSANEMAAIAHAGRAKRGWYSESAKAISQVFGPDAPHFAMLLAALSPQTSVESNLRNTMNVWRGWVKAGRPQDRQAIIDVLAANVEQSGARAAGGQGSVLDAWINNSVRALSYDDVTNIPMSGPKVHSFYSNLMGDVDAITLDTWMANYALVDQAMFKGGLNPRTDDPGKGTGYLAYSARVRETAAAMSKLTGETWTPAEVQETVWSWAKSLYELAERSGVTAVESLKAGTLTADLINSTPDFGSMFDEPEYAQILKDAGYGDELDSLRGTREATQRQPGEDAGTESQAGPFAEETQRRYELAAARRLDRLKSARESASTLEQSAFHGSPAVFDEFSLHAIGNGAQSFGWGLYFTSKKEIAQWYRDMLTPVGEKSAGRLYEAQIPDDDVLLNWDAPFSQQPPAVQQALTTAVEGAVLSVRGGDLYHAIARERGSPQAASEYLAVLGVKGVKFKGAAAESNFVVFDDKAIQIARYEQVQQRQRDEEIWNALMQVNEQTPPRGTIDFGADIKQQPSVISLLQNADLSTFLHESGHFYLEVLTDMAGQPGAPQEIVDDLNKTLKWFGVTPDEWAVMTLDEKRVYHEQWARGMESYLFEGKAPSTELQSLFGRFRAWMLNVYRQLVALNVTLTDEVRGVMDRLLATNDEIVAAENARSMTPLFQAKPEGMSDAEWKDYQALGADATQAAVDELQTRSVRDMQWLSRARGRALAQLQKDADAKRKGIRAEVSTEVNAQPIYAAERGLKRGWVQDDGSTIHLKINTRALAEMYPESMVDRPDLSKLHGMTNAETGLHPDQVAELTGFGSGDELVRKLVEMEPRASVVEGITDQRMLERYGDLADPANIAKAADEAVHNEARARFVASELRALTKATGERGMITQAARQFAEVLVSRKKIRDIRPAQFSAAETRAAKAAERATAKDDVATAAAQKRVQLVNLYATKAAYGALDEVEKGVAYFKRIADSKTVDPEYREQINALLERFDLRAVSAKEAARRASLLQWIESQRDKGFEPVIDEALVNEANRKPYREMALEDFRGLVDAVRNIEHLGRLKHKLLTLKDAREFAAVVEQLTASIDGNAKRTIPAKLEHNTWTDKMKSGLAEFFAMHRKFSMMAREIDGHVDNGTFWNLLVRPMNEAGDNESVMREQATVKLHELFAPLFEQGKLHQKTFIPEINASLSREGRIMVALNTGNEGNLQRLMDGDHWTLDQVQAVVDTLTKQEMDFVQAVWDFVGGYRQNIGDQQKRLTGVEPEWVEARKVITPHGEYAGGYLPAKYDTTRSTRSLADEAVSGLMDQWRAKRGTAKARDSFTKERANKVVDRPLRKDFGVITQHITEVTHRLAWQEYLVDANRLLRASAVDNAIREHYGPEVLKALRDTIEDVAAGEVPAQNAFERSVSYLRTGATIAGLGWRVTTSLLQPLGLTQSMVRIGPKWVGKGLVEWLGNFEPVAAQIFEKSSMMRLRAKTMQREISEIRNQVSGKSSAIEASYFYMIQKMQLVADIPTWLGQYHKAVDGGADEKGAIAQADQAVLDAQGGGQIKDLAGIQRGGPLLKLFTNFYSFFNTTYNLTREAVGRTNPRSVLSLSFLAVDMLLLYSVPAALGTLMKAALHAGDDDQDQKKVVRQLIADQLTYLFGTLVGLREVSGGLQTALGLPGDYQGPASVRLFAELAKLGKQAGQGEVDEAFLKALNSSAGILLHYPAGQINATVDGIATMARGKTDNPGALIVGSSNK